MTTWDAAPAPETPRRGPFRAVFAVVRGLVLLSWLILAIVIYLPLKWVEPLPGGRCPRYAVMRVWARGSLRILGLRRVVHGTPPPDGVALVANHSSWIDIMAFCSIGRVAFVAKSEVAGWPGIGWCARMMDAMFVERRASAAARQKVEMVQRLAGGQQLLFFPEGTSTDGQRVLPFKSPLFAAFVEMEGTTLQPVAAIYVPAAHLPQQFYGWWGDMSIGGNLWTILAHSYDGTLHLSFAPPVEATKFSGRKELAHYCGSQVHDQWAQYSPAASPITNA